MAVKNIVGRGFLGSPAVVSMLPMRGTRVGSLAWELIPHAVCLCVFVCVCEWSVVFDSLRPHGL